MIYVTLLTDEAQKCSIRRDGYEGTFCIFASRKIQPMHRILLFLSICIPHLLIAQEHDTLLTETARFIAGIDCTTPSFIQLQNKSFYGEHKSFCNSSWKEMTDTTLAPMVKWATEKDIISQNDTGTCFYPFSGPDYLFADQFFPNCSNYIMLGLERLGSLSDVLKLNDANLKSYLDAMRQSQRYLLKSGYFVTSHMSQDFSKAILNGNIHLMMYFLIRTGHLIRKIEFGGITSNGEFKVNAQGYFRGLKITAIRNGDQREKSIYYFSFDAADYKIKPKPEFQKFVAGFGQLCTYIKSASYIPAHKNFSIIRTIVLNQSSKILQDDTGVPYKQLDQSKYDVQLWGTYTKTIKDLSWGYDPELRKALEASGNNQPLPFRISYNGNYGEGMMLYAKRK